jgi:hypothetical protein
VVGVAVWQLGPHAPRHLLAFFGPGLSPRACRAGWKLNEVDARRAGMRGLRAGRSGGCATSNLLPQGHKVDLLPVFPDARSQSEEARRAAGGADAQSPVERDQN